METEDFTRKIEVKDLRTGEFTPTAFKDVKPGMVFRESKSPYAEFGVLDYPTDGDSIWGWKIQSFKLPITMFNQIAENETVVRIRDANTFEVIHENDLQKGDLFITSHVEHFVFRVLGTKTIAGVNAHKITVAPFPEEGDVLTRAMLEKQINDAHKVSSNTVLVSGKGSVFNKLPLPYKESHE